MDSLMKTPWFIKIIAFSLAALLFISINFQPDTKKGSSSFMTPSSEETETVEDVPVELYYDRKNLVVSGAPEKVDVVLKGPKSIVLSTKNQRDFKVFIDLADAVIGEQKVMIQVSELSDKLKAEIRPQQASVTVQEKITKEYSVSPYFNTSLLEEGYIAGVPDTTPGTVRITGAEDVMSRISIVRASIEIDKGANESVQNSAKVMALDENLNKLDVAIVPDTVEVRVPIKIPSKTVPITAVKTGKEKDGTKIDAITVNPKEVTLYGKQSELDKIGQIRLPVDIGNIDSSEKREQKLQLPDGIQKMSQTTVSVSISATREKETEKKPDIPQQDEEASVQDISKTFRGLDIAASGLPDEYELTFITPAGGKADMTITGPPDDINKLDPSNIQLSIDAAKLTEGRSEAPILAKLPEGLTGKLSTASAAVQVDKKEAAE
ncbi:YbbR-like domain-containing protein [Peribacillus sp. SCS-26]|uniref:CdaR family protein n=1 Tax=Paraperibacillus marinus TaxID=3115295 RepID=UPI0039060A41